MDKWVLQFPHVCAHSYAFPKKLRKGDMSRRKCMVKIENATMGIRIPHGYHCYSVKRKEIPKGSILEIWGSIDMDGVPVTTVRDSDGDIGAFWPNDFGNISRFVEFVD